MGSIATLICTMNRPEELATAVEQLQRCDPCPLEIVVSDDSAPEDFRTSQVCSKFNNVRYQRGPRKGLAANRNACLRTASADYVHFIDDDVRVPHDFYYKVQKAINLLGERTVITGFEWRYDHGVTSAPTRVEPPRAGFWAHMGKSDAKSANCVVINAAVFPRRLFATVTFDEYFKYGYEESDVTLQGIAAGYPLAWDASLHVDHYPSMVNRDLYQAWIIASLVYAGLKRQWVYNRSPLRTIAFLFLAVPRVLAVHFRRHGLKALSAAFVQAIKGFRQFVAEFLIASNRCVIASTAC